jgi:hypothetical protein
VKVKSQTGFYLYGIKSKRPPNGGLFFGVLFLGLVSEAIKQGTNK